jgi:hypothetical protein
MQACRLLERHTELPKANQLDLYAACQEHWVDVLQKVKNKRTPSMCKFKKI